MGATTAAAREAARHCCCALHVHLGFAKYRRACMFGLRAMVCGGGTCAKALSVSDTMHGKGLSLALRGLARLPGFAGLPVLQAQQMATE